MGKKANVNYWWLTVNPKYWSLSEAAVGTEQFYTLYNEKRNKRRIFANFLNAKVGDIVIGYESQPMKKIVGICQITKENDGEFLYFRKIMGLEKPIGYKVIQETAGLENMEFSINRNGSLFKVTKGEFDILMGLIEAANPGNSILRVKEYHKEDYLEDVYMSEELYKTLLSLLKNKKNIILQGPPGVGKTFCAKRLAYSIMGEKDDDRIGFVQFHQSYGYEDFVIGYRPVGDGFNLQMGVFLNFCQKAANDLEHPYFFIIDEINRGNISKIFGEMLMLIENSYRNEPITLPYSGAVIMVPENVYMIGMMNTADRSLAFIDYALRRRFSFVEMNPAFNHEGFTKYQRGLANRCFDNVIEALQKLNQEIKNDPSLGAGYCIGHSYFCNQRTCEKEWLLEVIQYEIIPLLQEYWFDDKTRIEEWQNRLLGVLE